MGKWLDATSTLGLLAAGFAGGCLISFWSCQIRRAAQSTTSSEGSSEGRRLVSIAVHGGAYAIPDGIAEASVKGVSKAAAIGYEILLRGGSALEAVEAAVRELERNPAFDAGVGSVLNEDGGIEMDAMIMDGRTLECGAVAGMSSVEHPVTAARLVMQDTNHVMFVGEGADRIAHELGMPTATHDELVTSAAREEWNYYRKYRSTISALFDNKEGSKVNSTEKRSEPTHAQATHVQRSKMLSSFLRCWSWPSMLNRHTEVVELGHDTVGAVAYDCDGHVAAATSTGGITAKKKGRCGDSPIVGSGGYAADGLGAVSTTGHGEAIIKVVLAHRILAEHVRAGSEGGQEVGGFQRSVEQGLEYMKTRVNGYGGVIGVDGQGRVGMAHTTKRMAWAKAEQRHGGAISAGLTL
ncbi:hypothetical protein CYMTET_28746 [Cymbomonas tetramitiformis]|uniref:Asparaginase n=1 Tax=Cymbomonas tetramitiformis TaxID=36881 RepID=A0AAE0KVL2_9CHLO|nr:hypothetical protein CYMTET_28746 [Cymbomonas tetramitiformis]